MRTINGTNDPIVAHMKALVNLKNLLIIVNPANKTKKK